MTTRTYTGKRMTGVVVKKSGDKTVSVQVVLRHQHPKYGKTVESAKSYLAHDPRNAVEVGKTVTIRGTRPISAKKRWIVIYDS